VCNEKNYFIPNTFSPNGDGTNDVFYPRGSGINRIFSMRIFNRWGELVFERKDFNANEAAAGWNGTVKGKPAEQDVYVYIIEFICDNATIIPYRGNVALIR
jgi:gliding motility-associated-like protein